MNLKNFIRSFSIANVIMASVMILGYGLYIFNKTQHKDVPSIDAMKAIVAFVIIFATLGFISTVLSISMDAKEGELNIVNLIGGLLLVAMAIIALAWGSVSMDILGKDDNAAVVSKSSQDYALYGMYAVPLVTLITVVPSIVNTTKEW